MGNFENWLMESNKFDETRQELAKWLKGVIENTFRVPVARFIMDIDDFISKFGMKNYQLLTKHNLLHVEDEGNRRTVKVDLDGNSVEAECRSCGIRGKASDPKCATCGAVGEDRFK